VAAQGVGIASFAGMRACRLRLSAAASILAVGLCSAPARSSAPPRTRPNIASRVARDIVGCTNVARQRLGRIPFHANPRLMRAAQIHAEQMARARQLAHVLTKAPYPRTEDRLAAARYRWQAFGEDVALGQSSAEHAVESWMHSRGHRANILNPTFTELGAGYATDEAGRPYYVQVFAGPAS
jgi:uncharacterized protein YkwD